MIFGLMFSHKTKENTIEIRKFQGVWLYNILLLEIQFN